MRDLPRTFQTSRSLKALAVITICVTLSGCYSCSLNGGWEGQMNPFCVEKDSLIGPISLPNSIATASPGAPALVEPRGRPLGRIRRS